MKRYITRTFTVAYGRVFYDTPNGVEVRGCTAYKSGKKWVRFLTDMDEQEGVEEIKTKIDELSAKEVLYRMPEEDFIQAAEEVVDKF